MKREHALKEIAQLHRRGETAPPARKRMAANEDLMGAALRHLGKAVYRRFKSATEAKAARNKLMRARGDELKSWAVFSRAERLYLVAPIDGAVPMKWLELARNGGAK